MRPAGKAPASPGMQTTRALARSRRRGSRSTLRSGQYGEGHQRGESKVTTMIKSVFMTGTAILAFAALVTGQTRVMEQPAVVRTMKAPDRVDKGSVQLLVVPAQVTLGSSPSARRGVFTILADPGTRSVWWAFRDSTTIPDSPSAAADEIEASHIAYPAPEGLVVFSYSRASLLVGFGTTYYNTPDSIPELVRTAFDSRASTLNRSGFGISGYNYYEKDLELPTFLGNDFFDEPFVAVARVRSMAIESVVRLSDGWQVTIQGWRPELRAAVILSNDFVVQRADRLP